MNQAGETFTYVKTIADRTKETREARGLSQVELAALAKVSPGTIGNLEAGTRKNPRELLAIAAVLLVNPEWLKSGKGPREIGVAEPPAPYSEQLALSPAERDLILALRKLPDTEQLETTRDVMHRAEVIEQVVQRELARRGISISSYVSATRAAENLPPPPTTSPGNRRDVVLGRIPERRDPQNQWATAPSPLVMTGREPQRLGRDDEGDQAQPEGSAP